MICDISEIDSFNDTEVRWVAPNGVMYANGSITDQRFSIMNGNDNQGKLRTSLIILNVSYMDNGTYACEVRAAGSSDTWTSAIIDLVLLGEIMPLQLNVLTR